MSDFDPYSEWLGIPPEEQPPDHYRLLGIEKFESDTELLKKASEAKIEHLRTFQLGEKFSFSQKLMAEVATARVCLLNSEKKAAYDAQLRGHSETDQEKTLVGPPPRLPPDRQEAIPETGVGTQKKTLLLLAGLLLLLGGGVVAWSSYAIFEANQELALSKARREQIEQLQKEEADRIAKEEAERKAQREAMLKERREALRKGKEEAARKAQQEAKRKAKEEARKAKEEADRKEQANDEQC